MQQTIHNPLHIDVNGALKPRTLPETLDRAFNIFRDNVIAFVGLAAAVSVPISLAQFFINQQISDNTNQFSTIAEDDYLGLFLEIITVPVIISALLVILQQTLIFGTITRMTAAGHFGQHMSITEAVTRNPLRLLSLFICLCLLYSITFVALLGIAALGELGIFFLLSIPAYIAICGFAFSTQTIMLENTNPLRAVLRAWGLARGHFKPVFWTTVFLTVMLALVQVLFLLLQVFIIDGTIGAVNDDLYLLVMAALNSLLTSLLLPAIPAVMTLLYYDTRVRLEGLDLQMHQVQMQVHTTIDPSQLPPPPPSVSLGRQDIGNMAMLWGYIIGALVTLSAISLLFGGLD